MRKVIFAALGLLALHPTYSQSIDYSSLEGQLVYSTVRIESTYLIDGQKEKDYGTGFFFDFSTNDSTSIPCIVTNKHVVEGAIEGGFVLIMKNSNGTPSSHTIFFSINDFDNIWKPHPDKSVDLCIMPLSTLIMATRSRGIEFYYKTIRSSMIPDTAEWNKMNVIENIVMIGYPNGLFDEKNHIPLIRTGSTSSPPALDYNGKKEFLIDAACFWGSSGSPVFKYPDYGSAIVKNNRVDILGVLSSGPLLDIEGLVVVADTLIHPRLHSISLIPINLGYVIKSSQLEGFRILFE